MEKIIIDKIDVTDYANYWFDRCCEINRERSKYLQALQEIRKYATDLIDGAEGGCEPDIGTILLKKVDEVIGVEE